MIFKTTKPGTSYALLTILSVLLIAGYRLLPHPWNFAPVTASAVFSGMVLSKRLAWIIPVASLMISDLWIGFSWPDVPFVYGSILIAVLIGTWVGKNNSGYFKYSGKIVGGTFFSSVLFYLITNFGSWLTLAMYPKTFEGLMASYINAVPFFQNSLAGDLIFITMFVVIYETASKTLFRVNIPSSGKI